MKRKSVIKILMFLGIPAFVITAPLLLYYIVYLNEAVVPIRPPNIPESSVWIGGHDGGLFYEVVKKDSISLRMKIYFENGDLREDGIFVGKNNLLIQCVIDSIYKYIEFSYIKDSIYYINLHTDWINRTNKLISIKSFIK